MADIAYDLLAGLERADGHPNDPGVAAEYRRVTAILHEQGFSDAEIALALGNRPEPTLDEAIPAPRVARGG